jgi:hypothetical protein
MTRVNSLTIWMSDGPHRNLDVGCTFPHPETWRYIEQFIANLIFDTVRSELCARIQYGTRNAVRVEDQTWAGGIMILVLVSRGPGRTRAKISM